MRKALQELLHRTWYGDRTPGFILSGLERLYKPVSALHRRHGRKHMARDLCHWPVVVVGNLTAGGAGKKPMVIRLCELARECGLNAGVISRGYGRTGRGPVMVNQDTDPAQCGDEPLLIARRCQVPVLVDTDRERAARELFRQKMDLVISDDGLQRARLPRVIELCLVDSQRGFGNGRLLPAGPLREPVSRLETVDFVIEHLPAKRKPLADSGYSMYLKPGRARQLHGDQTMDLDLLKQGEGVVHAVAGISRPERFFEMLGGLGMTTVNHAFPDHHQFRKTDFINIPANAFILMTEKDAVKCRKLALFNAWYVPVDAVLSEALTMALKDRLSKFRR